MQDKINKNVKRNSLICTDEAGFYKQVRGYHHLMVNHSVGEFVNGMASTNGIESVWALLKRGYNGTYHHFSRKHTDRYVNEFAFRLNQGNVRYHTMDRIKSLLDNANTTRLTYSELVA